MSGDNIINNSEIKNITSIGNNNKNKTNMIDNTNITKYYKYKQITNKDEERKIKRPGLADKGEGTIIPFEAIIAGVYNRFDDTVTIINVHMDDEFLADHTQLMLNETLEKFIERNGNESCLIKGIGKIKKYPKNESFDWGIELLSNKEVIFLQDVYFNCNTLIDLDDNGIDECYNSMIRHKHDELLYTLDKLRHKINDLTKGYFLKDFIFHYIINQYSLNTLNVDMYKNTIQSNEINDNDLYSLCIILGNVLVDLETNEEISLKQLLGHIAMNLNSIQGIKSLKCDKKESKKVNKQFKSLCERLNVSFGTGWLMIKNRVNNFNIDKCLPINNVIYKGLIGISHNI